MLSSHCQGLRFQDLGVNRALINASVVPIYIHFKVLRPLNRKKQKLDSSIGFIRTWIHKFIDRTHSLQKFSNGTYIVDQCCSVCSNSTKAIPSVLIAKD